MSDHMLLGLLHPWYRVIIFAFSTNSKKDSVLIMAVLLGGDWENSHYFLCSLTD
jgi:hypothetical protein